MMNTITRTNFQNLLNPQNVCSSMYNVVYLHGIGRATPFHKMIWKRFLVKFSCNSQLTPMTQQQQQQLLQQQQKWTSLFSIELTTTKYRRQNLKFNIHTLYKLMKPSNYEKKNKTNKQQLQQEQEQETTTDNNTTTRVENCYPKNKDNTLNIVCVKAASRKRKLLPPKSMQQKLASWRFRPHRRSTLIFPCHAAYTSYNYKAKLYLERKKRDHILVCQAILFTC